MKFKLFFLLSLSILVLGNLSPKKRALKQKTASNTELNEISSIDIVPSDISLNGVTVKNRLLIFAVNGTADKDGEQDFDEPLSSDYFLKSFRVLENLNKPIEINAWLYPSELNEDIQNKNEALAKAKTALKAKKLKEEDYTQEKEDYITALKSRNDALKEKSQYLTFQGKVPNTICKGTVLDKVEDSMTMEKNNAKITFTYKCHYKKLTENMVDMAKKAKQWVKDKSKEYLGETVGGLVGSVVDWGTSWLGIRKQRREMLLKRLESQKKIKSEKNK